MALADLDSEDGSFHGADAAARGVHHFGFAHHELQRLVESAGFSDVAFVTANTLQRPQGDFPIFLLTAKKPAHDQP